MGKCYPTDLSDDEWGCHEPHVAATIKRGRPRTLSTREILNAVFYVLKSGCPRRLLPRVLDRPKSSFAGASGGGAWNGTFERLNAALRDELRYYDRFCAPAWKHSSTWQ
jgi:putative transposase